MVEVASYRTPAPVHHITYRDKTAPPPDWSQILQQLYTKLHWELGEQSLEVASHIRSFLPLEQQLPPKQLEPHPDPTRFQRLDHGSGSHRSIPVSLNYTAVSLLTTICL